MIVAKCDSVRRHRELVSFSMRMIRHETVMDQRVIDVLAVWSDKAAGKLPTLQTLDPLFTIPKHIGWTMLINTNGVCRLAGDNVEVFLGCGCKDVKATTALHGRAGNLALDVMTTALNGRRAEARQVYCSDATLALAALPYVCQDNEPDQEVSGVMLVLSPSAKTLRGLNAAFDVAAELRIVSIAA